MSANVLIGEEPAVAEVKTGLDRDVEYMFHVCYYEKCNAIYFSKFISFFYLFSVNATESRTGHTARKLT